MGMQKVGMLGESTGTEQEQMAYRRNTDSMNQNGLFSPFSSNGPIAYKLFILLTAIPTVLKLGPEQSQQRTQT